MSDHTIARLNSILERYRTSSTGRLTITPDDVVFLQAAKLRLAHYEELHEVLRLSILDKGTASVSADVLKVMEDSGWNPLDKERLEYVRRRNSKLKQVEGRRVSLKLWMGSIRVNHADKPDMVIGGIIVSQEESGDREGTLNLHIEVMGRIDEK